VVDPKAEQAPLPRLGDRCKTSPGKIEVRGEKLEVRLLVGIRVANPLKNSNFQPPKCHACFLRPPGFFRKLTISDMDELSGGQIWLLQHSPSFAKRSRINVEIKIYVYEGQEINPCFIKKVHAGKKVLFQRLAL
jgi:hypothetical protein